MISERVGFALAVGAGFRLRSFCRRSEGSSLASGMAHNMANCYPPVYNLQAPIATGSPCHFAVSLQNLPDSRQRLPTWIQKDASHRFCASHRFHENTFNRPLSVRWLSRCCVRADPTTETCGVLRSAAELELRFFLAATERPACRCSRPSPRPSCWPYIKASWFWAIQR